MNHIDTLLQTARPKARATLIRLLGDMDSAEEALQEACLKACKTWPQEAPGNPSAWLVSTGRNAYIDAYRKQQTAQHWRDSQAEQAPDFQDTHVLPDEDIDDTPLQDDGLRLIFTCCHPALSREAQIALTLRVVADLSVEEIARAFLLPIKTLEQRITRAKRKIKQANIPYAIPDTHVLPERLDSVLSVIYLIFNEGYQSTLAPEIVQRSLCEHALHLGRWLLSLYPQHTEVCGLYALMLQQHARYPARLTQGRGIQTLETQDRSLWNRQDIALGKAVLERSLRQKHPGPYQLQAAIAALHNEAANYEATDWQQIEILYRLLEKLQPTPIVTLNRVVALCHSRNAEAAWELFLTLAHNTQLHSYSAYHAVKGHLLERLNAPEQAIEAYQQCLQLSKNPAELQYLQEKLAKLQG